MAEFTHDFFDESSREFMRGKIRDGHMIYYACSATLKSGKPCSRRAIQDALADRVCKQHIVKIDMNTRPTPCKTKNGDKRRSQRLAERQHCSGRHTEVPTKV